MAKETLSELSACLREGLPRAIQVIKDGLPRAEKQLADSEQRLADITKQPHWETLPAKAQAMLTREARADVARNKKSLSEARAAHAKLKKLKQVGLL